MNNDNLPEFEIGGEPKASKAQGIDVATSRVNAAGALVTVDQLLQTLSQDSDVQWVDRCNALLQDSTSCTQSVDPQLKIDARLANIIALRGYAVTKLDKKTLGEQYEAILIQIKSELEVLLTREDCFKPAALALLGKIAAIEAANLEAGNLPSRIEYTAKAIEYYNAIEATEVPDDVTILLPGYAAEMSTDSFRTPSTTSMTDLPVKKIVKPGRYLITGTAALGGLHILNNDTDAAKQVLDNEVLNALYQTWVEQSGADPTAIAYAPLNARLSLLSAHAVRLSLTNDSEEKNDIQLQLETIRQQIDTLNEHGKFTPGKYEEWVACVNASLALVGNTPEFKAKMANLVYINLVAAIKSSEHIAHAAKFDTVYRLVLGNKLDELLRNIGQ